ncbi:MAG: hypothetical protein QOF61_743, partial [Acidobacteriota bacterium]|nr:hypothetical protein [Acidobacteriota bacterium]
MRTLHKVLIAVPFALVLCCGKVLAEEAFTYSGDTTHGTTFHRPAVPIGNGLSQVVGTNVRYHVLQFTVTQSGTYIITSDPGAPPFWERVLLLYQTNFDPQSPLTNLLSAMDRNTSTNGGFVQISYPPLQAGTSYYLVTTGDFDGDFGKFTNTITGPGVTNTLVSILVSSPYRVSALGQTLIFKASITNYGNSPIILSTATAVEIAGPDANLVNEFASLIRSPLVLEPGESTGEIPFFKIVTDPSFSGPLPAEDNLYLRVVTEEGSGIKTVAKAKVGISVVSPTAPILLLEASSKHAIALDSVTLTRDPFHVHTDWNFSSDGFTRIALFVSGLRKDSDANYLPVSVRVDGCPLEVCELPVEYVADAPGLAGVAQVFVR